MNNNLIKAILERELESKNLIFPFIAGLTGREQKILEMRSQGQSLQKIGDKLEITRERVRQIEERVKIKIKFQKDIIQILTDKLGSYLFEEKEIENAFLQYLSKNQKEYTKRKLDWLNFNKFLWKEKDKALSL